MVIINNFIYWIRDLYYLWITTVWPRLFIGWIALLTGYIYWITASTIPTLSTTSKLKLDSVLINFCTCKSFLLFFISSNNRTLCLPLCLPFSRLENNILCLIFLDGCCCITKEERKNTQVSHHVVFMMRHQIKVSSRHLSMHDAAFCRPFGLTDKPEPKHLSA